MPNQLVNLGSAVYGEFGWVPVNDITKVSRANTPYVGSMSLLVEAEGANSQEVRAVRTPEGLEAPEIDPAKDVTLSFWFSYNSIYPVWSRLIWLDASGAEIGRSTDEITNSPDPSVADWRQAIMTRTPPAGARRVAIEIEKNRSPNLYIDAVNLNQEGITEYVPSLRVREDLDVIMRLAVKNFGVTQDILRIGDNFAFTVQSGSFQIAYGADSDTITNPYTNRAPEWVRFTVNAETGITDHTITVRTSSDGENWTVHTTVTDAGAWALDTSNNGMVKIGGGGLIGAVQYLEIRDGIDGPVLCQLDMDNWALGSETHQTPTGQTASIVNNGDVTVPVSLLDDAAILISLDDENLQVNHSTDVDTDYDQPYTFLIGHKQGDSDTLDTIAEKRSTQDEGFSIVNDAGSDQLSGEFDDTAATVSGVSGGDWQVFGLHYTPDDNMVKMSVDGVYGTAVAVPNGDPSNTQPLKILGRNLTRWFAVFKRELTDSEMAQVRDWDGTVGPDEPSFMRNDSAFYWNAGDPFTSSSYSGSNEVQSLANSYSITADIWNFFEATHTDPFEGVVDENGPWKNGVAPRPGNTNFAIHVYDSLTRSDFSIPNNDNYVVTWMGVDNDNSRTISWIDTNTVEPANVDDGITYPDSAITEYIINGTYTYEPVVLRAKIKPEPDPEWNPQVHSGYYYNKNEEYYLFAKKGEVNVSNADQVVLPEVANQGAPVIVHTVEATPVELRRVAFMDAATPGQLSLEHIEEVPGSGSTDLYLSFHDVYDVTVEDEDGNDITDDSSSSTNVITVSEVTDRDSVYTVTYTLNNSYYVDNEYVDGNNDQRSLVVFDSIGDYVVHYEESNFDPATPIDLPLNAMHTSQSEGFVYISHNEYTLDNISVRLSPGKIVADGNDYLMVTLISKDENGNPKENASFELSTSFGTLDKTSVTTDRDGFAVIILTSSDTYVNDTETLTITGDVSASVEFEVMESSAPGPVLVAAPQSDALQADGESKNIIFGKIYNPDFTPVSGASVEWKKARSIYELFNEGPFYGEGTVTSDSNGNFSVGPITVAESDESGYWFVSLEATVDGSLIGDVVFWLEYPDISRGVEGLLPNKYVQMATPADEESTYWEDRLGEEYEYWEDATPGERVPVTRWEPPPWYAVSPKDKKLFGVGTHVYKSY